MANIGSPSILELPNASYEQLFRASLNNFSVAGSMIRRFRGEELCELLKKWPSLSFFVDKWQLTGVPLREFLSSSVHVLAAMGSVDDSIIREAISIDGRAIMYARDQLLDDLSVVREAIRNGLLSDEDHFTSTPDSRALHQEPAQSEAFHFCGDCVFFESQPTTLKHDLSPVKSSIVRKHWKELIRTVNDQNPTSFLIIDMLLQTKPELVVMLDGTWLASPELILELIMRNPLCVAYASNGTDRYKPKGIASHLYAIINNVEFAKAFVNKYESVDGHPTMSYFNEEIRSDTKLARIALQSSLLNIDYISKKARNAIGLKVCGADEIYYYTSLSENSKNIENTLMAVKNKPSIIDCVPSHLLSSRVIEAFILSNKSITIPEVITRALSDINVLDEIISRGCLKALEYSNFNPMKNMNKAREWMIKYPELTPFLSCRIYDKEMWKWIIENVSIKYFEKITTTLSAADLDFFCALFGVEGFGSPFRGRYIFDEINSSMNAENRFLYVSKVPCLVHRIPKSDLTPELVRAACMTCPFVIDSLMGTDFVTIDFIIDILSEWYARKS